MSGPASTVTRPRWLVMDGPRSMWAAGVGTLFALVLTGLIIGFTEFRRSRVELYSWTWFWVLVCWACLTVADSLLTWLAFRGLTGRELVDTVLASPRRQRRASWWRRIFTGGGGAASTALTMAALALVGVIILLVDGRLRHQPGVLLAAGALVLAAWVECVVCYALHYAREDSQAEFLCLPDEPDGGAGAVEKAWIDYVYLAVSVQTTFGVTDATVMTRHGRRLVTLHALLAFGFNTVLVALMVSLALGG